MRKSWTLATLLLGIAACSSSESANGSAATATGGPTGSGGNAVGSSASSHSGGSSVTGSGGMMMTTASAGGGGAGGCAPPATTWAHDTTKGLQTDGDVAKVGFDCDGVYTLSADGSQFNLDKWNQTDGSSAWSVPIAAPSTGAVVFEYPNMAVAAGALYITTPTPTVIEKHDASTGAVVWQVTDTSVDQFCDVAADASGIYTLGHIHGAGYGTSRLDKRSASDGSILWSAAIDEGYCGGDISRPPLVVTSDAIFLGPDRRSLTDGSVAWTTNAYIQWWVDAAVDSASEYVASSFLPPGNGSSYEWEVVQLDITSGTLGWNQTFNMSMNNDSASAVAVSSAGLFVGGYEEPDAFSPNTMEWHVDRLDPTTGAGTWDVSIPIVSSDTPHSLAADSQFVYVAGSHGGLRVEKRKASDGTF